MTVGLLYYGVLCVVFKIVKARSVNVLELNDITDFKDLDVFKN